jgi:ATP-binding cassette, sub-family E, member 1
MIKMLAGLLQPDPRLNSDGELELPRLNVSYKPQTIAPKFEGTVEQLFRLKIQDSW